MSTPWGVVGQEKAISILNGMIANGRVSHAYLFSGPDGVGKTSCAVSFAGALNCLAESGRPCWGCASCRKINTGNHPNVRIIVPDGTSIKIGQTRELKKELAYRPYEGGWRVFVLQDCEKMTDEAANSLLKALEEPPEMTVFILVTSNEASLLPTIISRCQVVRFQRVSGRAIKSFLMSRYEVGEKEATIFAALSGGIVERAIKWVEDASFASTRKETLSILGALTGREFSPFVALEWADRLQGLGSLDDIFDIIQGWYRDLLVLSGINIENMGARWVPSGELLINTDMLETLLSQTLDLRSLLRALEITEETRRSIQRNANVRLALEAMLLRLRGVLCENDSGYQV